jgi:hypothetical protein
MGYLNQHSPKNNYKIDGQTLIVYDMHGKEMLFDAEDIDILQIKRYRYCITSHGYAFNNTLGYAHKILLKSNNKLQVDHINGNRLDNRKANLRLVTSQENKHNNTVAKGYSWDKARNKWSVKIKLNRKGIFIGRYNTETEARTAYLEAKKIYHPTAPIQGY